MRNIVKNHLNRPETLQLRLFGPPQIILDGAPVPDLTSDKARGLLFYLVFTRQSHPRLNLATLFWGGHSESAARGNLRKALQQLRKQLGAYLIIERKSVALAADADCWVDAVEFDALMKATSELEMPGRMQRAIDLYFGDFLEGFYLRNAPEFESWWLSERARLRENMLDALHTLADHRAEEGNLDAAIDLTRRYLDLEPWREGAHRRLMSLLARNGQRSVALVQYEICRKILADELGVEPADETTALYIRIKKDEIKSPIGVAPRSVEVKPDPLPFLSKDADESPIGREYFVGRQKQLDCLEDLLKLSVAEEGRVIFVCGEAGSGKTSLVSEFSRQALEVNPEMVLVTSSCDVYTGVGDPYLPFREILQMLTGDLEKQWRAGILTRTQAERQWQLLPDAVRALMDRGPELLGTLLSYDELNQRLTAYIALCDDQESLVSHLATFSKNIPDDPDANQSRLNNAYNNMLKGFAQRSPLLLILEDLHWADLSSIGLLNYLGHHIAEHRILLVGTFRPEDVAQGKDSQPSPLQRVLSELKHIYGEIEINLDQANTKERRGFVDDLLDTEPNLLDDGFRQKLAKHTHGNPLFTVETLNDMRERGDLRQDEDSRWIAGRTIQWDTLPAKVEGVIEKRYGRLESDLHELLTVASIEGEIFTTEVLAQVTGEETRAVVRRLSGELDKIHHLVRAQGIERVAEQRISHYRFRHQLIQKYIYNSLDEIERAFLHEAVANALEMIYKDHTEMIAVQLAEHFLDGGLPGKAIGYLIQAGDAAARSYAHAETISFYKRALGLTSQVDLENDALIRLYVRLGRAMELISAFDQALKLYQEMEEKAVARQDRSMHLSALAAQVTIQAAPTAVSDRKSAEVIGEKALVLADELDDQEAEAKILWSLSLASFFTGRLTQAIERGERSLSLSREGNLIRQQAQTLNDLGSLIYLYSGNINLSIIRLQEATELWRELGNQPMLADSLSSSCVANVLAGEFEQAISLAEEAQQISQSINNIWGQSYSRWKVGCAYWERGDMSRAVTVMEDSVRLGKQAGFIPSQDHTQADLAAIYADLGMIEKGLETAATALEMAEKHNPIGRAHVLGIMAQLYILKDEWVKSGLLIQRGHNDPNRESWPVFYVPILLAEIELSLAAQEFNKAENLTIAALDYLQQYGMRNHTAYVLYLQGHALQGSGRRKEAGSSFTAARREAEAIGSKRILWRVLQSLSKLEADPAKARGLHQESRQVLGYILEHIDQKDTRRSFLNQPDVQAILNNPAF